MNFRYLLVCKNVNCVQVKPGYNCRLMGRILLNGLGEYSELRDKEHYNLYS